MIILPAVDVDRSFFSPGGKAIPFSGFLSLLAIVVSLSFDSRNAIRHPNHTLWPKIFRHAKSRAFVPNNSKMKTSSNRDIGRRALQTTQKDGISSRNSSRKTNRRIGGQSIQASSSIASLNASLDWGDAKLASAAVCIQAWIRGIQTRALFDISVKQFEQASSFRPFRFF